MEVHLEKQNHQFDYVEEFYNLQYKGLFEQSWKGDSVASDRPL